MAAQGIKGQSRRCLGGLGNLPIGHKPQLDKSLEAVADAQHQAVTLLKKLCNRLSYPGISEGGSDELAGTIGLIAAGEAAGQHDNLGFPNHFLHSVDGFLDAGGAQILHHQHTGIRPGLFKGAAGIVFTVGSRKHRNKHTGLCRLYGGRFPAALVPEGYVVSKGNLRSLIGEDGFQLTVPGFLQLGKLHPVSGQNDDRFFDHIAHSLCRSRERSPCPELGHNRAGNRCKEFLMILHVSIHGNTKPVAERHFGSGSGHAAFLHNGGGKNIALFHQREDLFIIAGKLLPIRKQSFCVFRQREYNQLRAGLLQSRRHGAAGFSHGNGKAHQRGGNVQLLKGSAHAILAADGRKPQLQLRRQSTQKGCRRLAPSAGDVVKPLEIFLEGQAGSHGVSSHRCQLGKALHHCIRRAVERRETGDPRDIAIAHGCSVIRLPVVYGEFCHHGLFWSHLVLACKGH